MNLAPDQSGGGLNRVRVRVRVRRREPDLNLLQIITGRNKHKIKSENKSSTHLD